MRPKIAEEWNGDVQVIGPGAMRIMGVDADPYDLGIVAADLIQRLLEDGEFVLADRRPVRRVASSILAWISGTYMRGLMEIRLMTPLTRSDSRLPTILRLAEIADHYISRLAGSTFSHMVSERGCHRMCLLRQLCV